LNNKKVSAVTSIQFFRNFKFSVIFLFVYALVVAGLTVLLYMLNIPMDVFYQVDTFVISTKVFLILVGAITFYSTFKDYILQGVTRKEFVVGSLTAIAILCLFFTIVLTGVYIFVQHIKGVTIGVNDTILLMAVSLLIFYTYYAIGWFLGMAVLKYRFFGRFISFIFAITAIVIMEITTNIGFSNLIEGTARIQPLSIPLVYNLLSTVIIAFLITYYVYSKAKKIYIRV